MVVIIKKYEDKITYWISEPDNGIYGAMNKGVLIATGDYIQFLSSDDCLYNCNTINSIVEILQHNNVDILSGTVWMVDEKTNMQYLWENKVNNEMIYNGYMVHHQGMFARKEILENYPFNVEYRIVSDYEFILNTYFDPKIKYSYINMAVAFFSLAGISGGNNREHLIEKINVMEKFSLNPKVIDKYKKILNCDICIKDRLKSKIKEFLSCLNFDGFVQQYNNWEQHRCNNSYCRWCNRYGK